MSRNRSLVVGLLLVGQLSLPVAARAEPVSPLYELVDTASQRLSTADPVAASNDAFSKKMVDEIALQWNSLHSPGCAAELTRAKAGVVTARQLDALYQQALSSATRSYCQLT